MAMSVSDVPRASLFCSQRWILAVMAALGSVFFFATRVNLSLAIICMVKSDDVIDGNLTSSYTNLTGSPSDAGHSCGALDVTSAGNSNDRGEFTWDKATQSRILSMYYYGYILTQIPGGWLALRFGGKLVWGVSMLLTALCTLATPISARTNVYLLHALRFFTGFVGGVSTPCISALLGKWTPPYERSKLSAYTYAGPLVGSIATLSTSGFLCENGFDNGWGSIFYLAVIFHLIWVALWFVLTADSPAQHKRIKQKELEYIQHASGKTDAHETIKVPWASILRCRPLWAMVISHVGSNYTSYTLLSSLPMFMKESLQFDIKENGIASALPFVSKMMGGFVVSYVADTIREKRWLSTKTIRKSFQTGSFAGVALCMSLVGHMDCSHRYLAVFLLCLASTFQSGCMAGFLVNHLDLAPSYAGILMGISNTVATIPGILAPIIAGALTPNKSAEEWRNVFYLCAAIAAASAIVYLLLAEGELQTWANPERVKATDTEIEYPGPKSIFEDDADLDKINRKLLATADVDLDQIELDSSPVTVMAANGQTNTNSIH